MLLIFRSFMKSLLFKIVLFGLLLASFLLWGISDTLTGNALGRNELARVGKISITLNQYQQDYRRREQSLLQKGVTQQELRNYALPYTTLSALIDRALLSSEADRLGITTSQKLLQKDIFATPEFQGIDGNFSTQTMQETLRYNGLKVKQYYDIRRRDLQISALLTASLAGHKAPTQMQTENYRFVRETRNVDYVSVTIQSQKLTKTPSEEMLQKYYQENKQQFHQAERREIAYIHVNIADIARNIKPNRDEIVRYYREHQQDFTTAEQRAFQLIFFTDSIEAAKFYQALQSGADFEAQAKQQNLTISNNDLQNQNEIVDAALAKGVFAVTKPGQHTNPIEGTLGFYVAFVEKIIPQKTESFENVQVELQERIAQEKTIDIYFQLLSNAEDLSISGSDISEIADSLDVTIQKTGLIDHRGQLENSEFSRNLLQHPNFLPDAFALANGDTSFVTQIEQQGFYLVKVEDIRASYIPEYLEIVDQVKSAWENTEKRIALRARLMQLQTKIMDSEPKSLKQIAAEQNYAVLERKKLNRFAQTWPANVMHSVFLLRENGLHLGEDDNQMLLFQVNKIEYPLGVQENNQEYANFLNAFNKQYGDLITSLYKSSLQKKHKTTVNEKLFQQLLTQADPEQ